MSIEYLNAAFMTNVGDSTQKFVLVCLADFADEHGYAYPSITTLEKKTDLSRPSVIACLKALLDKGFITKCSIEYIPKKYLKKSNQNCYHLEIIGVRLVKELNQLSSLTSKDALPDLVKELNQCLVKQLNPNHQEDNHQYNHQNINTQKKSVSRKKKLTTMPKDFCLSDELIEWGKQKGYSLETLKKHFEYFLGYAESKSPTYASWNAAFQQCVRGNWAKLPNEGLAVVDTGKKWFE